MTKIAFIGGGSAKFVAGLVRDVFSFEELRDAHIALMDINPENMDRSERIVRKMIGDLKIPATVSSTTDQRKAIEGADYVIITVMVGGFKHYDTDNTIPMKYGVYPTVGDTTGAGGVMRIIRTAPVMRQIAKNVRETAPNAWIFNYTNPMSMVTWSLMDAGHAKTVGLCHSIQGDYVHLAHLLGVPPDEVRYTAAGINHIDFYITLTHKGKDLYPLLLAKKEQVLQKEPSLRVKFELLEHLGGWPAEGPQHQTEYYPWFRKNREMGDKTYAAETLWGFNIDKKINSELHKIVEDQISGAKPIDYKRSHEFGAWMIHSVETNTPRVIYGNVRNHGLIENLPSRAVVEVPCLVDANGVQPCAAGRIPMAMAAVMQPHISLHEMAIEAVKTKNRKLLYQAIGCDPLANMVLTLDKLKAMTDELLAANSEFVADYH
jgi:alpha-galactosidase